MSETPYILHYAPDNASLVIRLALEELRAPFTTRLVDRRRAEQRESAYLKLNPNGLIPVLETSDGAIFETAAILLWLADTHGALAPQREQAERGSMLKWLFFLSNTFHPVLRHLFYPTQTVGPSEPALDALEGQSQLTATKHLRTLDRVWADSPQPMILSLYLAPMLRWIAIYPKDSNKSWFRLADYPALYHMAAQLEERPSVDAAVHAEGLGQTPFTSPTAPKPPEGSAT
ncbi:MAG: glutathione S-transferase family protein [Pseudomonadota bacterium]